MLLEIVTDKDDMNPTEGLVYTDSMLETNTQLCIYCVLIMEAASDVMTLTFFSLCCNVSCYLPSVNTGQAGLHGRPKYEYIV